MMHNIARLYFHFPFKENLACLRFVTYFQLSWSSCYHTLFHVEGWGNSCFPCLDCMHSQLVDRAGGMESRRRKSVLCNMFPRLLASSRPMLPCFEYFDLSNKNKKAIVSERALGKWAIRNFWASKWVSALSTQSNLFERSKVVLWALKPIIEAKTGFCSEQSPFP